MSSLSMNITSCLIPHCIAPCVLGLRLAFKDLHPQNLRDLRDVAKCENVVEPQEFGCICPRKLIRLTSLHHSAIVSLRACSTVCTCRHVPWLKATSFLGWLVPRTKSNARMNINHMFVTLFYPNVDHNDIVFRVQFNWPEETVGANNSYGT